jgi:hypothetical protein
VCVYIYWFRVQISFVTIICVDKSTQSSLNKQWFAASLSQLPIEKSWIRLPLDSVENSSKHLDIYINSSLMLACHVIIVHDATLVAPMHTLQVILIVRIRLAFKRLSENIIYFFERNKIG